MLMPDDDITWIGSTKPAPDGKNVARMVARETTTWAAGAGVVLVREGALLAEKYCDEQTCVKFPSELVL